MVVAIDFFCGKGNYKNSGLLAFLVKFRRKKNKHKLQNFSTIYRMRTTDFPLLCYKYILSHYKNVVPKFQTQNLTLHEGELKCKLIHRCIVLIENWVTDSTLGIVMKACVKTHIKETWTLNSFEPPQLGNTGPSLSEETDLPLFEDLVITSAVYSLLSKRYTLASTPYPDSFTVSLTQVQN